MKDYYSTLGVARNANADEIKRAYRKLASQHHPDKGGDTEKFQEIQEAYAILSDDQKRQAYDNPQPNFNFNFQSNGPFDFDSIFDIFGARFGQQQHRPRHMKLSLWITLNDVVTGGRRTVAVGTQSGTQAIEIEVPLGINDGESVQYPGLAPGGVDLIITYRVRPDPRFNRQANNLWMEHTVDVWDLILGGDTEVRDALNNPISLTIPKHTQPGTILRLKGKGVPQRQGQPGDLLVKINTKLPNSIPFEIEEAIRKHRGQ